MNENQRTFLAIGLCVAIFLVWQLLAPPPIEPPPTPVATPASATATESASSQPAAPVVAPGTAAAATPTAAPGTPPPVELAPAFRELGNALFKAAVRNRDGALSRLDLTTYFEHAENVDDTNAHTKTPVAMVAPSLGHQARPVFELAGRPGPALDFVGSTGGFALAGTDATGVTARVELSARSDVYGFDYLLKITNNGPDPVLTRLGLELSFPQPKIESGMFAPAPQQVTGVCGGGSIERRVLGDLEEGPFSATEPAPWVALDRQYFVIAVVGAEAGGCSIRKDGQDTVVARFDAQGAVPVSVAPGQTLEKKLVVYAGPKRDDKLAAIDAALPDVVDYDIWGMPLGAICRPMLALLNVFHGWSGSWGIAIALLTLVVKLLMLPVTWKASVSMRRMQLLKPELDKLKERLGNDRERMQMEQLKLFREKGVNPLGGCLPMLLQMPVWLALYRSLWTAVDLYEQSFLWLSDLTAAEPGIPWMAVILGGVTVVQQLVTPMSPGADPVQMKIMKWVMPIMFTVIMVGLPSGLVLYVTVNSIMTIAQQAVINKRTVTL